MPTGASVKANRFNITKSVYALVTKDDSTGFTCGAVKKFGDPMTVVFTPVYASGIMYGGGVKTEDTTKMTGAQVKMEVNKILIETRADILGNTYASGILKENKNDQPKEFAFGYEIEQSNGKKEYVWLFKCKAKPFAESVEQTTDNMKFASDTIDIAVMPRTFDGDIRHKADTANPDFTDIVAATYLSTVPA